MDDQTKSRADPETEREIDKVLGNPCEESVHEYIRERFIKAFAEHIKKCGLFFVMQEHIDLIASELVMDAQVLNKTVPGDGPLSEFEMKNIEMTLRLLGIPVKENVEKNVKVKEGRVGQYVSVKYVSFTIGGKTYPVQNVTDE